MHLSASKSSLLYYKSGRKKLRTFSGMELWLETFSLGGGKKPTENKPIEYYLKYLCMITFN
jgi:hypothetical protein